MTAIAPPAPPSEAPTERKKKPSGHQQRKKRIAREKAEHEARIQLLKAQGKLVEADTKVVKWVPRAHQRQLEDAHKRGIRRQAHVWHRRAGKSAACLDFLCRRAMERPGMYWFMTPKLTQTRVAIWDSRRADGIKEIDVHIPASMRKGFNSNLMQIEMANGSLIKFIGSDGFDRLVGSNVHGIVFDEFALGDPASWDYLAPILAADPQSWAIFISTFRGKNHWYRMYERVKGNPEWHTSRLTIADTKTETGDPIITEERLAQERKEGKQEGYIQQEYHCEPMAALEGAFYAQAMRAMHSEKRIKPIAYDPALPVTVSVDLGYADEMVFAFWQNQGNEHRLIATRSWKFTNLTEALDDVKITFPWGRRPMLAILPHDGRFGTSELFERYGYEANVLPRTPSVAAEIEQVRLFLGRVYIDNAPREWTDNEDNNSRVIEALSSYRTARSTGEDAYQRRPHHDWTSHYADAVRYYVAASADTEQTWGGEPNYSIQDRAVI